MCQGGVKSTQHGPEDYGEHELKAQLWVMGKGLLKGSLSQALQAGKRTALIVA